MAKFPTRAGLPLAAFLFLSLLPILAHAATYKLGVTKSGTGTVTSSPAGINCGSTCSANFAGGTVVTLAATPGSGHAFGGWSGACTGTGTCTVTMTKAKSVTASFVAQYTLTVTKAGTGTGTVTSSPAGINCGSTCSAKFNSATVVTLAATPVAGYSFSGWTGACTGTGTCTVTMSAAKSVTASFALGPQTLGVSLSGTGTGSVGSSPAGIDCGATCSASFPANSSVTLTATPGTNATFDHWGGSCSGTAATCTLTLNAARAAEAVFAAPTTTTYQYDANGNLIQVTDPVGNVRQTVYDSLDRPTQIKEPHAVAIGTTQGQINLAYDGQDRTATVKDPRSLTTTYTVDGLGNLTGLASPDTGTATLGYDEAGNLKTRLDARGKLATYGYDALNRLVQVSYGDQTVTYTWDACTNGIGRLCQVIDGSGSTAFAYDAHGRVLQKTQTVSSTNLVTAYAYTAGQLTGITTPSGQAIAYDWLNGRVRTIRVNGVTLVSGIEYEPFGPVMGWTWGNGQVVIRDHDLAGRLRSVSLGTDPKTGSPDSRSYGYDAAGRVRSVLAANDATLGQVHGYDGLDRLTATQLGNPVTSSQSLAYDLSGNRTAKTVNGTTTTCTTPAASNRLASLAGAETMSFAYDAAGNTTSAGAVSYGYDNAGRRTSATVGGQSWLYAHDGFGQRVRKTGPMGSVLFAYDEAGHLSGEYDAAGKLIQETVWLGDTPVATLRLPAGATSGPANPFYVHADHLNTPRRITRPADNKALWQWESEPFGNSLPNENPQGLGTFQYNLRFPGQVFDKETGLAQNYHRDYDSSTGRFTSPDPLGLEGGSMSLYTYADNAPTMYTDPTGLFKWHGYWCGGDWTGAKRHPYRPAPVGYYSSPADYTDATCERHDKCFATCREMHKCDKSARKVCMVTCNADLASAQRFGSSSGTSIARSVGIWGAMQLPPDAEENDASCNRCENP